MNAYEITYLINDRLTSLFIGGLTARNALKNFRERHGKYLVTSIRQVILNDKDELEYVD